MEVRPPQTSWARKVLPWLNLIIMLFPPIHLYFVRGDIGMALLFFMGSSLFLIFSVTYLHYASPGRGRE